MIPAVSPVVTSGTEDAPALSLFHVQLFAVVRREVRNVAAPSLRDAVEAAFSRLPVNEFSDRFDSDTTDFADEFSHYLVDVAGDAEFTQSRFLTSLQEPLLQILRALVSWHIDGRPEEALGALIVEARSVLDSAV